MPEANPGKISLSTNASNAVIVNFAVRNEEYPQIRGGRRS
jgi:hypothetical protein